MSSSIDSPLPVQRRLCCGLGLLLAAASVVQASPCEQAVALREVRLLLPAHEICVELAKGEEAEPCAACDDLVTLAQEIGASRGHFARGQRLAAAGSVDAARQAFVVALKVDASHGEAREALKGLCAEVSLEEADEESCEEAKCEDLAQKDLNALRQQLADLIEVGALETAKEELSELVKQHPKLAPEILQDSDLRYFADGRLPRWRNFLHRIEPWARLLLEGLALLLILVAALRALPLLRLLRRWHVSWPSPTVRIEELQASGELAEIGPAFAARLSHGLSQPVAVGSAPYQMVTRSTDGVDDLPDAVSTAVPGTLSLLTALPALVRWLTLRREIVIGGTLYQDGQRGVAATITVSEADRILETKEFWEQDLAVVPLRQGEDDQSVTLYLAERVGVWLLFALQRVKSANDLEVMGTGRAMLSSGPAFGRRGYCMTEARQEAMRLYEKALGKDPRNLGAQVNLARLLAHEKGNTGKLEQAIRRLEQVVQATVDRPEEAARYASLYSLAVARYDLGTNKLESAASAGWALLEDALDAAAELKREVVARVPRRVGKRGPLSPVSWFGHRSQKYHETLLPGVEALWVGLSLLCSEKPADPDRRKEETDEISPGMAGAERLLRTFLRESGSEPALPLRALYNRACTLSIAARMAREEKLPLSGASGWRTVFEKVVSTMPALFNGTRAEGKFGFEEHDLVEAAYGYLAMAVRKDPSLARRPEAEPDGSFMSQDRSLEFLRKVGREAKEQEGKNEYEAIEAPHLTAPVEPSSEELVLAQLDAISSQRAARLSELGIDSWAALFLRVATPKARTRLARELGVGGSRLRQWAHLLDLLRIDKISIGDLNLLEKAHVHSREQLKKAAPEPLAALLVDLAGPDPEAVPPEQSNVDHWWRVAHTEDSLVVADA
ncbi:MAG: DUF4332 domain-containing protein [Acidobacteriota bacterium]